MASARFAMRESRILLAAIWMLSAAMACAAPQTLTFAADTWCPFNCAPNTLKQGFIVDIVRAVYEPLGYKVNYQVMPWPRAIAEARSGNLSGLLSTPKSAAIQDLLFPKDPVGIMQNALFKRHDDDWRYDGVASLNQERIGLVQGYVFTGEIGQYLNDAIDTHSTYLDLSRGESAGPRNILKLALGRVDLIADDVSVVEYEHNAQHLQVPFDRATDIGPPMMIYVAFPTNNPQSVALAKILDAGVSRLRRSGKLRTILAQYGVEGLQGGRLRPLP
jgi:polar amino acid transport system substrate-binding protein